jgi:hypothetical protein
VILSDLQSSIDSAISRNENLESISTILKSYKEKGIDQSAVIELLESMRIGADEEYEDRLLEILDVVSGFCDSKYTVW